jgi:hypothetical protein
MRGTNTNAGIRLLYNGHVGINGYASANYWLYVTGDCRANSWSTYSDSTAKTDIADISDAERIMELQPVSFKWKEVQEDRTHYGFLAQDVQQIFPDVVTSDERGQLAIEYDAFIPMLVDCYKKMNLRMDTLRQTIADQEQEILLLLNQAALQKDGSKKSLTVNEVDDNSQPVLFQNTPNPFDTDTEIRYYLPERINNARLYIYNMQGNQLRSINITQKGYGSEVIHGSDLQPGMYMYTLIVNGLEKDTKRMILTD